MATRRRTDMPMATPTDLRRLLVVMALLLAPVRLRLCRLPNIQQSDGVIGVFSLVRILATLNQFTPLSFIHIPNDREGYLERPWRSFEVLH
jgi:hypothetical protein